MDDVKCIQHDFKDLNPEEIINIQLRFPIIARIIPYNKLDLAQQLAVQENVIQALYSALNAYEITFGNKISYDLIYDTIIGADNRIKSLILNDFTYSVYAIYQDVNGNEQSIKISDGLYKDAGGDEITTGPESIGNKFIRQIKAKSILSGVTPLFESADKFSYSIEQKDPAHVQNIGKVTTNSEIILKFNEEEGEATLNLTPNESVYLTTNNYITKETYTNYCKYFYSFSDTNWTPLSADSVYSLKPEDYIIFLWKESNDEEEPYKYYKYKGDSEKEIFPIISPSFNISKNTNKEVNNNYSKELFDKVFNNLNNNMLSVLPNTPYDTIINDTQLTLSEIVEKCKTSCILSTPKSIYIKGTNKIELSGNNYKFYWVLNTIKYEGVGKSEAKYSLFEGSSKIYTLKTGEYLFYSPKASNTSFSLLGPGTKLELTVGNGSLSVKAKSYEEVLFGTASLLTNEHLWFENTGITIEATEMQFFNIGSESSITFKKDSSNTSITHLCINNAGISQGALVNSKFKSDSTREGLKGIDVKYTYQGTTVDLPRIQVPENYWDGYSILNINAGPDKDQILTYTDSSATDDVISRNQTITPTYTWNSTTKSFNEYSNPSSISTNSSNLFFQTDYEVEVLGGEDVDITSTDLLGNKSNINLYTFKKVESPIGETVNYETRITMPTDDNNIASEEIPINVGEDYAYIVPVVLNKDYNRLSLQYSSETPSETSSETPSETSSETSINTIDNKIEPSKIIKKGLYFFKINQNGTYTITLENKKDDTAPSSVIKILPLLRYKDSEELKHSISPNPKTLLDVINEFDSEKRFNYIHQVDPNILIRDPLHPLSFLDENHPYNQCTICKWDPSTESVITITNKIK